MWGCGSHILNSTGWLRSGPYPGHSLMHEDLHVEHYYLSYMPLGMPLGLAYSPNVSQASYNLGFPYSILLPDLQESRLSSCGEVGSY